MLLFQVIQFGACGGNGALLFLVCGYVRLRFLQVPDLIAQLYKPLLCLGKGTVKAAVHLRIQRKQHFIFFSVCHERLSLFLPLPCCAL